MRIFPLLIISIALSSCFANHPELQTASSLKKGEMEFGGTLYGGQIPLNQSIGVSSLMNYGVSSNIDISANAEFLLNGSSIKRALQGYGTSQFHFSLGPKFSARNNLLAIRTPITLSVIDGDFFPSLSPTVYINLNTSDNLVLYTRYNRVLVNSYSDVYFGDAIVGLSYFPILVKKKSVFSISTNGIGLFGGVGIKF